MKLEDLQALQPQLFARFHQILRQGKLAHAYLFTGQFAAREMALMLAQHLFCDQAQDSLPCGTCRTCRSIAQQDFPDVTQVFPQGNLIKTETVRELVKDFSRSGFEGSRQVFIIHEADKMHPNAANSLLKVIEEPQSEIYIFLLARSETSVLPTIKSRTQVFDFPKSLPYLTRAFEEAGLLPVQAQLLAELAPSPESVTDMATNSRLLELLTACQKLAASLLTDRDQAYLQLLVVSRLAGEKAEQPQVFQLLTSLLAKEMKRPEARACLDQLLVARQMWQANVSLQAALEYMVLQG